MSPLKTYRDILLPKGGITFLSSEPNRTRDPSVGPKVINTGDRVHSYSLLKISCLF